MGINRCRYLGLDPGFFIGDRAGWAPTVQAISLDSLPSVLLNGKRTTLEISAIKKPRLLPGLVFKDQTVAELSHGDRRPEER